MKSDRALEKSEIRRANSGERLPSAAGHVMRRRVLVAGLFAATAACLAAPLGAALPPSRELAFAILSADDSIGRHRVTFERHGEDLVVDVDIDIEVRFAFLTMFRYRHENREVWRDGRLVSLDAWTDDDGTRYTVTARATGDALQVEGTDGSVLASADIIPTSYWNPATVEQTQLLDTQRGGLLDVSIRPLGPDSIAIGSTGVPVRKFAVSGDVDLDLWYTPQGEWAKLAFEARGATVSYAPAEPWAGQLVRVD